MPNPLSTSDKISQGHFNRRCPFEIVHCTLGSSWCSILMRVQLVLPLNDTNLTLQQTVLSTDNRLIDWLIDWLNDWLIDWLVNDWLIDWLIANRLPYAYVSKWLRKRPDFSWRCKKNIDIFYEKSFGNQDYGHLSMKLSVNSRDILTCTKWYTQESNFSQLDVWSLINLQCRRSYGTVSKSAKYRLSAWRVGRN